MDHTDVIWGLGILTHIYKNNKYDDLCFILTVAFGGPVKHILSVYYDINVCITIIFSLFCSSGTSSYTLVSEKWRIKWRIISIKGPLYEKIIGHPTRNFLYNKEKGLPFMKKELKRRLYI